MCLAPLVTICARDFRARPAWLGCRDLSGFAHIFLCLLLFGFNPTVLHKVGPLWEPLLSSPRLAATLDAIVGAGDWEIPRQKREWGGGVRGERTHEVLLGSPAYPFLTLPPVLTSFCAPSFWCRHRGPPDEAPARTLSPPKSLVRCSPTSLGPNLSIIEVPDLQPSLGPIPAPRGRY